jgi:transposase
MMAHRYGERHQNLLFPQSIEDYIAKSDPVRVYDAFVDALDWESLSIACDRKKVGCREYDPKTMLKILLYGYSYGIRSSRKLERALYHNLSFIWLAGGLKPDDRTIARFRRKNRKALKKVFRQCARLCIKLNLVAGNTLFVDGTKLRANAGINKTRTPQSCEKALTKIDQRIDQILAECEQVDQAEQAHGSLVKLQDELSDQAQLREQVQGVLETLKTEDLKQLNTTDSDCARMHGRQGSHTGYNAQIVVDEQQGLIVNCDVVNDNNDLNQFSSQINQANEVLETPCKTAGADAGYSNGDDLEKIEQQGIGVIVPTRQQSSGKTPKPFDRCHFEYLAEEDCYLCPEGKRLTRRNVNRAKKIITYAAGGEICTACPHFGVCCKSKRTGRTVSRYENEAFRQKLAARYEASASQAIFSRRKETVELPFGHIKRNLGVDSFLLRGLEGVRAEMSILSCCFNLVRLIGILGVTGLLERLPGP